MPAIFTPQTTVFHPDVVPYISVDDYKNAPTAVDVSALVPGGSAAVQTMALAVAIRSASSWANNLCRQILAATLDTQVKMNARVRSDGTVHVKCDFWPVLEVDSFLAGPSPSTLAAITDPQDMFLIGRKVLSVPVAGISGNSVGQLQFPGPLQPGDRAYCQWSYWNGWPHSQLTHAIATTDQQVLVTPAQPAALAGRLITIWDATNGTGVDIEQLVVANTFTGGTTIPIVGNPQFNHALPAAPQAIMVSTFPDDVRQATISLTSALIKARGAEAFEMDNIGEEPSKHELIEGGGLEDLSIAVDLLEYYRRAA